jgi:hypothetical protein
MPDKKTVELAWRDRREGKSATTQAGEFVREEIHHVREGKHGARSAKQAIAIGLSKARRAGVDLAQPKAGTVSADTRKSAARDEASSQHVSRTSPARSRATAKALQREGSAAASKPALAEQAHLAASKRSAAQRSASARKGARTRSQET